MSKAFLLALAFCSISVHAQEFASPDLVGKWLILPEEPEGNEYWIFHEQNMQFTIGGKPGRPDAYRTEGTRIIFGAAPYEGAIEVTSFSGSEMETRYLGITQKLKKVD